MLFCEYVILILLFDKDSYDNRVYKAITTITKYLSSKMECDTIYNCNVLKSICQQLTTKICYLKSKL